MRNGQHRERRLSSERRVLARVTPDVPVKEWLPREWDPLRPLA